MADINVFQLTNQELHKSEKSVKKSPKKKGIKESVRRNRRSAKRPFSISANKLRFESLTRFLEDEDFDVDVTADYTPEDDVVLVIDPEMEEVPESTEEAEAEAEKLIGQHVCKCAICGANYVTDVEITEDFETEEEECPVCGETGEQIVVGVITEPDELSAEDEEDITDVDVEDEGEDEGEDESEDFDDADFEDEGETEEEEDEEDFGESLGRRHGRMRRESARRPMRRMRKESARRPVSRVRKPVSSKEQTDDYSFDDVSFSRMLTTFAKENYSNVRSVKITKGTVRGSKLTLEGVVTTTKGTKRSIKFVSENFKPSANMTLRFREFGPFTESVKTDAPTFVVECAKRGSAIIPKALKYSYKAKNAGVRESRDVYSVTGKVLSENAKRSARISKHRK